VKVDAVGREVKQWMEDGYEPGEPVFVPRPGGSAEDDGKKAALKKDKDNSDLSLFLSFQAKL
jgi:carotenoid cleavage dioxygenase-like enzyme